MGGGAYPGLRYVMESPTVQTNRTRVTAGNPPRAVNIAVTTTNAASLQPSCVMESGTVRMALTKATVVRLLCNHSFKICFVCI